MSAEKTNQAVRSLGPGSRELLESALAICQERRHVDVEMEHLLLAMLGSEGNDIDAAFTRFGVDRGRLASAINAAMRQQRYSASDGGVGRMASSFASLLEEALDIASLQFSSPEIRTIHLLLAILENPLRLPVTLQHSNELFKIKPTELRMAISEILATSKEAARVPLEALDLGAGGTPSAGTAPGTRTALQTFTIDLTEQARQGRMDPVVGRDIEIRTVVDILVRRRKNNPIILGEAGVGKTAVVEGFAQRIVAGEVPPGLRGVRLLSLDLGLLQAGAGIQGEFEQRLKDVVKEVKASPVPVILFIDEVHNLMGAGGKSGTGDAANLIKPELARGELRTIAATTLSEYKQFIEKDAALERRFQPVHVEEPDPEVAVQMIRTLVPKLEAHHKVLVRDGAVRASVDLSRRYVHGRQLPDKAVDLLDTASARVAAALGHQPAELDAAQNLVRLLEQEESLLEREARGLGSTDTRRLVAVRERLLAARAAHAALLDRYTCERDAVRALVEIRGRLIAAPEDPGLRAEFQGRLAEVQALGKERPLVPFEVDEECVAQVVETWTGIPVGKMQTDDVQAVMGLEGALKSRVLGQEPAIAVLAERLLCARADIVEEGRPIGVFLLAGPSGVGKTETALALADQMFGSDEHIVTINMSEYQEAHAVSGLKGPPPGYVGYGRGGVLTEAVRHKPYSVVLFDEFEKAHRDVAELFYQVFDKGILDDSEGRRVSFQNCVILLTTNVGGEQILEACLQAESDGRGPPALGELEEMIRPALSAAFPAALLGRMTVVPYRGLGREALKLVVDLKLDSVVRRVRKRHGIGISVEDAVKASIVSRCDNPDVGARVIDNIIRGSLLPALSRTLIERVLAPAAGSGGPRAPDSGEVRITLDGSGVIKCMIQSKEG